MQRPSTPFAVDFIVGWILLSILFPSIAFGQFANADLAGTVTSSDGAGLPGATVTVENEANGIVRSTVTAANGTYSMHGLKPGLYTVQVALDGFQTLESEGVPLRVGQETRLDTQLELGVVDDVIHVAGATPVVETTSKELGGTLTSLDFEALPTQNRSALLFAGLMPGVIPSPSTDSTASDALFVNGQDDNDNGFFMDGANNDDDVIGARAGAQTRTPMEAIQEFQVLTSQFDAEFGRAVGGVLNAITKSGGNSFEGSVFAFYQDSSWNEENFFTERAGLEQPDTSYQSLGFTMGGPMIRDRLHFFVSYEDNLNEEGQIGSFDTRPDLNFATTEDNDIENTLLKLDYQPFRNHHLAFRFLLEESPQFNQIIPVGGVPITLDAAREEDDTDSNWVLTLESVLGPRAFNNVRVSFTKEDVSFANPGFNNGGQTFESQRFQDVQERHPGFVGGASTVAQSRINRSTQVDDTFSLFLPEWHGRHELRFGFQYSEREQEFTNFGTLNGELSDFLDDRPFDPTDIDTYPGIFNVRVLGGLTADIPKNETLGLFFQDDWQVGRGLTLSLGARYDDEDITDDANLAPRLGFAWDLGKEKATVIRGGYGRFYNRFQLGLFANFFLDSVSLTQGFILRFPDAGSSREDIFDIAQANGVQSLNELRDVLILMLESGAGAAINIRPTVDNPDREHAYVDSFSLGAEREIFKGLSLGVDLIHTENRDILLLADVNPAGVGGRPNISVLNGQPVNLSAVQTYVNAAETDYDALQISLRRHFSGGFGGRVSYTYADSEGNTQGGGGGTDGAYFQTRTETGYDFDTGRIIGQPLSLNLDDARTQGIPVRWHREHNLVISGTYKVPGTSWKENQGLLVSWLYRYMSGDQYTLFENSARLDNGNRRPLASGTYQSSDPEIGEAVSYNGRLRGGENPDLSRLDVSLRYAIPLGGDYSLTLLADIFNITNEDNFGSLNGGRVDTGTFLTPTNAFNPREIQLGVRFEF